jgi:hypothetical protein
MSRSQVAQNTWKNANLMRDEALKNHEYVKPAHKLNSKQQQQPPLSLPGASISSSHHHHSEDVFSTSPSSLGTPPDTCSSPVDGCGGRELAAASKCKGDSCGRGQHQQAQQKDMPVDSAQAGLDEAARTHGQGATRPSSHLDDAGPLLSKRRRLVPTFHTIMPAPAHSQHLLQLPFTLEPFWEAECFRTAWHLSCFLVACG